MAVRLTLICQGASAATRTGAFPADEGLDAAGLRAVTGMIGTVRRVDAAWTGPGRAARETAEALGVEALVSTDLREIDYGVWAGRSTEELNPEQVVAWMGDPSAAPHGGESIAQAVARMEAWMMGLEQGRVLAVVPVSLARAAVVIALGAPVGAFWRVDVAPLGRVVLSGLGGRWNLQALER